MKKRKWKKNIGISWKKFPLLHLIRTTYERYIFTIQEIGHGNKI